MSKPNHKKDPRKLMVRLMCVILCFLMLGGVMFTAVGILIAKGASSSQIREELEALQEQADEIAGRSAALQEELAANATETQTTIEKKVDIDRQISLTQEQIENTKLQIQQYNLLIAEKQKELEASELELAEMNERYRTRLRAMEESGSVSYWAILFQASNFSDLLSRMNDIHEVAEADERMIDEMALKAQQIEDDRAELEAEMDLLEQTQEDLALMELTLEEQRGEADELLLELEEASNNLTEEYLANAEREAALQAELIQTQLAYEQALSAEQKAAMAAQNKNNVAGGGTVSGGGSGFSSPLNYLTVTCAFGPRIHPLWNTPSNHTGVDLAANQGDPIYAIASGTVTAAGYSDAYGYNVTLSHGNGYGSMYAHMTNYTVSVGQSVTQGQIIGYVGSTGWSTGPHLHFEIYVNGAPVNPMKYIG